MSWKSLVLLTLCLTACPQTPVDDTGVDDTGTSDDTGDSETGDSETGDTEPQEFVRIVTWNIQAVSPKGTTAYTSALAILQRLDADVVALNEVSDNDDMLNLQDLAADAGYSAVIVPSGNPFGTLRNAILSRRPVSSQHFYDGATLSGDSEANDMTRYAVHAQVHIDEWDQDVHVIAQHWKSGFEDVDEFRRVVDSRRTAQAALLQNPATAWVVVAGDVNAQPQDQPEFPATFTAYPSADLPFDYWLGSDLYTPLTGGGLANHTFAPLTDAGLSIEDAKQPDGSSATRPASGRRLDYLFTSPAIPTASKSEVFDCADDDVGVGRPKAGSPLSERDCFQSSDHLPVFLDLIR